jgi:hypothetical protein
MSLINAGFAIRRNGSCLRDVEDFCDKTADPFVACCPNSLICPLGQTNYDCCPLGSDCADPRLTPSKPLCANATWDLFDNEGYFCCEKGLKAYNSNGTNGCSRAEEVPEGVQLLSLLTTGVGD